MVSPYGEGGRALVQSNLMVGSERVIIEEGKSKKDPGLADIRRLGVRVGLFPSPLMVRFSHSGQTIQSYFSNDHIDRVSCLLKGANGKIILLADPLIQTVDWSRPDNGLPWSIRDRLHSLSYLRSNLNPFGVEVKWPRRINVPYSLNMLQFPDGRVLMTGGDPDVKALVEEIVGQGRVVETEIPIQYFPTWKFGGIRCMVGDAPIPIMLSR
jgi:hypothetical protein